MMAEDQATNDAVVASVLHNLSISSSPPEEDNPFEALGPNDCVDMNEFLWHTRHDVTAQPAVMTTFAGLYAVVILLGVVGNLCVIVAIARIKSLQTVPNMFIFSLSCSDILVCCISATITPISAFRKDWVFGPFLCSTAPFIAGVSLCFSTFTLAAISVDRFMLIIFPTRKAFSHAQALFVIMSICLLASVFSLPVIFMQKLKPVDNYCGEFCFEDWGQNNGIRRIYGTLMLTVQFIIPVHLESLIPHSSVCVQLALIIFCYTAISLRLAKSVNLRNKKKECCDWQVPVSAQRNAATKRRQRTNRMFIAMVIAFSLSWIWSVLYNLLRDYECLPAFIRQQEFFFGILTHCIAMSSTVWNPVLYALLNLQLRAAFIQLVPACIKNALVGLCGGGGAEKSNALKKRSTEESRLLGTQTATLAREAATKAEGAGKKWIMCFLNSAGSIESSTSDRAPANNEGMELLLNGDAMGKQNGTTQQNGTSRFSREPETMTMCLESAAGGAEERTRLMRCDEEEEEGEETDNGVGEQLETDENI